MARSVGRCRWVRWSPGSGRPALRGSRALRRRLPRAKPPARPRRQPSLNPPIHTQYPPPTPGGAGGPAAPPAPRKAAGTAATAAVPEPGHATAMSPPDPMVGTAAQLPFRSDGASLRATPLARSLARERGVDLLRLRGSGPGGRIVGRDVPATSASSPGAADTKPRLHLHWWRHGKVPVLLLHGFGADHASWRPLVEQLPPG